MLTEEHYKIHFTDVLPGCKMGLRSSEVFDFFGILGRPPDQLILPKLKKGLNTKI